MSQASLTARIDKGPVRSPQSHEDPHLPATGRAEGDERCRRCERSWREIDGVCLQDHQAEGGGRDGTAGMQKAAVADLHKAIGQDMLEESADTLHGVERGRTWASTAGFTGGKGDGTVLEAHDAAVGNSHFEDIRGEVLQGGVAVWIGLAVDVPGDGPDLWVDLLQQTGVAHVFFKESTGDGGEGFHGDKEVGSGRQPLCAVLRQPAAWDKGVDMGMKLELPPPGVQDAGKAGSVGADEARIVREAFEGR